MLKSMLKFFTKNFHIVVSNLEILLKNQHDDYITKFADVKKLMIYNLSKKLMRDLISKISSYALQKIRKQ